MRMRMRMMLNQYFVLNHQCSQLSRKYFTGDGRDCLAFPCGIDRGCVFGNEVDLRGCITCSCSKSIINYVDILGHKSMRSIMTISSNRLTWWLTWNERGCLIGKSVHWYRNYVYKLLFFIFQDALLEKHEENARTTEYLLDFLSPKAKTKHAFDYDDTSEDDNYLSIFTCFITFFVTVSTVTWTWPLTKMFLSIIISVSIHVLHLYITCSVHVRDVRCICKYHFMPCQLSRNVISVWHKIMADFGNAAHWHVETEPKSKVPNKSFSTGVITL